MKKFNWILSLLFIISITKSNAQCTSSIVPIAQFGGPGTYVNQPSGFVGPFQVCNNAIVYDTMGTSNRRYYMHSGTTLYLKNSFFHYVYLESNATLVNLGGIGDINVFHMINSPVIGTITPPTTSCTAVIFPTVACNAPTATTIYEASIEKNQLLVYPIPASNILNITASIGDEIYILNLVGQVILKSTVSTTIHNINVESIPEGIYILQNRKANVIQATKKIIIKH
jgi:hypothetical protein